MGAGARVIANRIREGPGVNVDQLTTAEPSTGRMTRVVAWTVIFAIAMAFVESAVVVYLRALAHGGPFVALGSPLLPPQILGIEVAREAATLVMLAALACVASRDSWDRQIVFWLAFATWDLAYYGWLWVLIRWPPSLLSWDVLFLIPIPWAAPVLAPVLVSLSLLGGVWALLRVRAASKRPRFGARSLAGIILGGLVVFGSFVVDVRTTLHGQAPDHYHWELFTLGALIAVAAFAAAVRGAVAAD
jgi:hypothetical protein